MKLFESYARGRNVNMIYKYKKIFILIEFFSACRISCSSVCIIIVKRGTQFLLHVLLYLRASHFLDFLADIFYFYCKGVTEDIWLKC